MYNIRSVSGMLIIDFASQFNSSEDWAVIVMVSWHMFSKYFSPVLVFQYLASWIDIWLMYVYWRRLYFPSKGGCCLAFLIIFRTVIMALPSFSGSHSL